MFGRWEAGAPPLASPGLNLERPPVGAGGTFLKGAPQQAFVEPWNGPSWQVVPSPSVGTSSTFWAVGAVSAKDVWAVGDAANGNQGFQTLTEPWNGSRWGVVTG